MTKIKTKTRVFSAAFCAALALSAQSALAEVCTFTTECFEDEACTDTMFQMTIDGETLITDAETIAANTGGNGATGVFVGSTSSAMHLLIRQTGGAARYSTITFAGPMMVSYLGTCE